MSEMRASVATPSGIVALVRELVAYVEETAGDNAPNCTDRLTHPIPFFGDLPEAEIITVGVNPSAGEFATGRGWPAAIDAGELTTRLVRYFDDADRPPHPWFARWEEALAPLEASYHSGGRLRAAHLDFSPRATVSAGAVPDKAQFARMVEADLPWALRFLATATRARLVLMAGAMTNRHYMNEFVTRYLPPTSGRLEGTTQRSSGRGNVLWHTLVVAGRRLPVFFCSSSPSDRREPTLLRDRIAAHSRALRSYLG